MSSEYIPFLRAEVKPSSSAAFEGRHESDTIRYSPRTLYSNFYAMAIAFSINHGCVVTCLAYAPAILGNNLGSVYSGILYVCYAVTSFLFATPIVSYLGTQQGLLVGVIGYCIYVGGFMFAVMFQGSFLSLSWFVACLAAAIGGFAGGLLWTAQGRYFTQHCKLYSDSTGTSNEVVTTDFAGIFASIFLGIELCTKIIATVFYLISPTTGVGTLLIFMLYTLLSIATCFVIAKIEELDDEGNHEWSLATVGREMVAAPKLVYLDHRLALLMPFQLAFGFGSSFIPYYVFGTVVDDSAALGRQWVGILSAFVVLSGAVASIPAARIANMIGKSAVISFGSTALVASCSLFFLFSDNQLGTWLGIIPLLLLYGVGRGIWENTNKAVMAEFYADDKENSISAFASSSFFTGYASAMGYFAFPYASRSGMAGICVLSGIIGLICYRIAFIVHRHMQHSKSIDKNAILKTQYRAHLLREKAGIKQAYASRVLQNSSDNLSFI